MQTLMPDSHINLPGAAPNPMFGRQQDRASLLRSAQEHLSRGAFGLAMQTIQPLLEAKKPDAAALQLAGSICLQGRRPDQAKIYATRSLALKESAGTRLMLAQCERLAGNTDKAIAQCERAARESKYEQPAKIMQAGALEEAGRFDEAREIVQPMIEAAAADAGALDPQVRYEHAKLLVQSKDYAEAIAQLDQLIDLPETPPEMKRAQLHLRAKACDRMKEYTGASDSAQRANEIGKVDFDPDLYEEQVSALIEVWSKEHMAKFPRAACDSELPVFVAGMPRSGTSLIDQIIDAHPKAGGVGEMAAIEELAGQLSKAYYPDQDAPDCFGAFRDEHKWTVAATKYVRELKKLAPRGAERVVNKALGNNKLVGLVACLFPKTRIIHAIRDPRDVAISCFMGGFNNNLHAWTTQLDWAARAWEQSMRMMEHWKEVLDVPILDVHYEKLVTNPDEEFPRIIEFLGLEWDDACRAFHKSKRTVRTLSYDQVNRPLYTTSAGRHANYAEWLKDIAWPGSGR